MKKILGQGVATSQGENWFKPRKLANHFFLAESLKVNGSFLDYLLFTTQKIKT